MSQKQIEQNGETWLLVEVPEGASDLQLHENENKYFITYHVGVGTDDHTVLRNTFPPGQWQIFGRADSLTEEQWREIVKTVLPDKEIFPKTYINYETKPPVQYFNTATESGKSWIRANGFEETKTLILKLVK